MKKGKRYTWQKKLLALVLATGLAFSVFPKEVQAAAKTQTNLTISKGTTYNIIIKNSELMKYESYGTYVVNITPLDKKTEYDSVIYSGGAAMFGRINVSETKKTTFYSPTLGIAVKNKNYSGDYWDVGKKADMLAATITVKTGRVKVEVRAVDDWDGTKTKKLKFTAKKANHEALRKTTLRPGESFNYVANDKKSKYARVNLELVFAAQTGTKLDFAGEGWTQRIEFKNQYSVWSQSDRETERADYSLKKGKLRYVEYYNMSQTGKMKTNKTVTIYSPYVYEMQKVK